MPCGVQSNLRYSSSCDHHVVLLRSINNTLCMYILDWNCFHDNGCSFQSLPFSKRFREIRLGGKLGIISGSTWREMGIILGSIWGSFWGRDHFGGSTGHWVQFLGCTNNQIILPIVVIIIVIIIIIIIKLWNPWAISKVGWVI